MLLLRTLHTVSLLKPARTLLSTVVAILCALTAHAQSYDFISYNVENGLPQSKVTALFQDSRGYLWVGTAGGGVCSFDGINFTEYNEVNGLGGNIVTAITEDESGVMWFGSTWGGLTRFDGRNFRNFTSNDGLPENHVNCLLRDGGTVWIGTPGGLASCATSATRISRLQSPGNVSVIFKDSKGRTWFGAGGLLYYLDKGKVQLAGGQDNMVQQRAIYSIAEKSGGRLLLGTSKGLLACDMSTSSLCVDPLEQAFDTIAVQALLRDVDGSLWFGTEGHGLYRSDAQGVLTHFDETNGLPGHDVTVLLEDDTRRLWIGTGSNGLVKLRSQAFRYYEHFPGLSAEDIFTITETGDGQVWVGSQMKGLFVFDGKISKPVPVGGINATKPDIKALLVDSAGSLWVGHANGLAVLSDGKTIKQYLQGIPVRSLAFDKKGQLWIGTSGKGLYKFDGKDFTNYTAEAGQIPHNYVHKILCDKKGTLWFGTGNGLGAYDGKTFTGYSTGLCNAYIGSMAEDRYGHIWCGTDKCVARFDKGSFKTYDQNSGLKSATVFLMTTDAEGHIWVGTNKGLDRLTIDSSGEIRHIRNYGIYEGFRGVECNSRAVAAHGEHLWFGTVKGLIQYNAAADHTDSVPPRVQITDISLFLEKTSWLWQGVRETGWYHLPEKLDLTATQNHLTFHFTGIHLNSPQGVRYKFMLEGFDAGWSAETDRNEMTYSNLPPGNYIFKVMACNSNGVWSPAAAISCPVVINAPPPPYWQSWWFAIFLLLITGVVLYYFTVVRTRRIRRQKNELEDEVRDRTHEIVRQNEEKTVMLKEIHHRVKNNLQIISSLINLQSENIQDPKALALFDECRHRIISMAMIHEKMYESKNLVNIDIRSYINELISYLIDAYDLRTTVRLETEIEEHPFIIDTIVPLGLILNETISNSLKYAFGDRGEGKIFVSLKKKSADTFELLITDDGRGLPKDTNLESANTLGLQLIHMLTDQLNGTVKLEPGTGTRYRITFRNKPS